MVTNKAIFRGGRFPNGTGNFQPMNTSFNTYNNNWPLLVTNAVNENIQLFPNPTSQQIKIIFPGKQTIRVYDAVGRIMYTETRIDNTIIDTHNWPNGLYWLQCGLKTKQFAVLH